VRFTNRFFHFLAMASILVGATAAAAGPSGAIFTTNATGTFVNGNVYDAPEEVYLNGGPRANQRCTSAGLPDGWYIFRVTDPSGHVELTELATDDRILRVENGIVKEYPGTRNTGVGRCNDLTVALSPFGATPNPGGEYKVWLTPIDLLGNFDFHPSNSKTDNFKVVPADTDPPD
jgi:hypothetical protein